jgi:carbamoyl-phosphate synthase large subunit
VKAKVLVTGAGALLGQGIIRSLQTAKLETQIISADPSAHAAGLYWTDTAYRIPMASSPGYLDRLRDILKAEKPQAVLIGTDVELPLFAEHRATLERDFKTNVLVSSPRVVAIADDKYLTYEFLKDAGFDYPATCLPGEEKALIEAVGFPLVVKPRIGARSIGVSIARSESELKEALRDRGGLVIQECVGASDSEYTASTLVFDGKCRAAIVMRRDLRDGNTYRAFVEDFPELSTTVRRLGEALAPYGPANFQFRLDKQGHLKVFEINARFSGTTPLRALAGFNEVEMCLRHLVLGEPISQPKIEPMTILRHWSETVVRPADVSRIQ